MTIRLHEAIDILDVLGCGEDPVYRKGVETTVRELEFDEDFNYSVSAGKRKIKFYGKRGRLVKGTVADMVLERMGIKKHTRTKKE